MCLKYKFVMVVVSTSSVVWSQVRLFFVLEYFSAINHDEIREPLWLSLMFYSIVTQYYTSTLCPRYTEAEPDIWLALVSNGSEAYPMLMGRGSSARYEEMKQRGTSILKTFIIYSIFSYVQHGRIHQIKHRWSLALTLVLTTLTTLLTPL